MRFTKLSHVVLTSYIANPHYYLVYSVKCVFNSIIQTYGAFVSISEHAQSIEQVESPVPTFQMKSNKTRLRLVLLDFIL